MADIEGWNVNETEVFKVTDSVFNMARKRFVIMSEGWKVADKVFLLSFTSKTISATFQPPDIGRKTCVSPFPTLSCVVHFPFLRTKKMCRQPSFHPL